MEPEKFETLQQVLQKTLKQTGNDVFSATYVWFFSV